MESAPKIIFPDLAMFCPVDKLTEEGVYKLDESRAEQMEEIKSVFKDKLSDYTKNVGAVNTVHADIGVSER
jgi:hypothetical protein